MRRRTACSTSGESQSQLVEMLEGGNVAQGAQCQSLWETVLYVPAET